MNPPQSPTNERIVQLLEQLTKEVREVNERLDKLSRSLVASGR
jgi:hypothetical protein